MQKKGRKIQTARTHKRLAAKRTLGERWRRIRFVLKGLTVDELIDRFEEEYNEFFSYSEKIWGGFILFQFKHTYTYCY